MKKYVLNLEREHQPKVSSIKKFDAEYIWGLPFTFNFNFASQQLWKSIKIFYAEYIWGLPLNDGSFNFASQKITNHNNYERQSRSFMQNIRIYIIYGSRLSFSEALTSKSLDKKFTSRIITFTYFHGSCCIILNITNIDAFDKFSTFFNFSSAKIGKLDGWGDDKIMLSLRYFFTVAS